MANFALYTSFAVGVLQFQTNLREVAWEYESFHVGTLSDASQFLTPRVMAAMLDFSAEGDSELQYRLIVGSGVRNVGGAFGHFVRREALCVLPEYRVAGFLRFCARVSAIAARILAETGIDAPRLAVDAVTKLLIIYDLNGSLGESGGLLSVDLYLMRTEGVLGEARS